MFRPAPEAVKLPGKALGGVLVGMGLMDGRYDWASWYAAQSGPGPPTGDGWAL